MTIRELAREAGVSLMTISRAINSETRGQVSSKTLAKINRLVKRDMLPRGRFSWEVGIF